MKFPTLYLGAVRILSGVASLVSKCEVEELTYKKIHKVKNSQTFIETT